MPSAKLSRLGTLEHRLGYVFQDRRLLRRALTHKSASADNFERFEFLGDAALGFVVGRMLFDALPEATEHRLTLMRASLVHGASLAAAAKDLDLGAFLELGAGERKSGVATRSSVLADALEAVLGAVVCDGGIESAEVVARRLFANRLTMIGDDDLKDPKTKLQEILQSRHLETPIYEVIDRAGPDHERLFTTLCRADSLGLRGEGRRPSFGLRFRTNGAGGWPGRWGTQGRGSRGWRQYRHRGSGWCGSRQRGRKGRGGDGGYWRGRWLTIGLGISG